MSEEIVSGFINQVQPPELPVFLAKIEPLILIKNEPPELDEEIIPDIKDVDLVSYILPENSIKSETVSETTFETKHVESVETQVFVKTENAPFVKIENITEGGNLNKPEDTGNKSINKAIDQRVVEVQDKTWRYHCDKCAYKSYHLCKVNYKSETVSETTFETKHIESVETQVFVKTENAPFVKIENITKSEILNKPEDIGNKSINKARDQGKNYDRNVKYHCDNCAYKTCRSDDLKRHKILHLKEEKIQYFYCHHCSHKTKRKDNLIAHISRHFRKGNVTFHCFICDFATLQRNLIITHIRKHPKLKLFKLSHETETILHDQHLKYNCEKCDYKTHSHANFLRHKIIHLKPEEIQYFYCYHCSHKSKLKADLQSHISRHFKKGNIQFHCYMCNFTTPNRDLIITHIKKHTKFEPHEISCEADTGMDNQNLKYHCDNCTYKTYRCDDFKRHKLIHLKQEKIQYFYCYHCSYKSKRKDNLRTHISKHFGKENVPFHCYVCDFVTLKRDLIIAHIKKHTKFKSHEISCEKDTTMHDQKLKLYCDNCTYKTNRPDDLKRHKIIHLKPEEIQYFHCHHCPHKSKRKDYLKIHLLSHFRKENVPFHCYICNFVTLKRDLITKHIRRHSKVQLKCEIKEEC